MLLIRKYIFADRTKLLHKFKKLNCKKAITQKEFNLVCVQYLTMSEFPKIFSYLAICIEGKRNNIYNITAMINFIQEVQNKYSFLCNLLNNFWKSWIKSNLTFKLQLKSIKWKNEKAKPGCAYKPTEIEQLANVITHGVWIIPSLLCQYKLFERSKSSGQYLVSWIYGSALSLIFIISSCFHCSCYCSHNDGIKNILHRCDRAMIYIFIAASYFPWLLLENPNNSVVLSCMEWLIWLMAASGIAYQQVFHERFKCLETCFYILMGLGPAAVVLFTGHEFPGMTELKLGGFFYMLGICFFKSDGIIPMAHAIWHLFVVIAAGLHYYAILVNLYPLDFSIIQEEIS